MNLKERIFRAFVGFIALLSLVVLFPRAHFQKSHPKHRPHSSPAAIERKVAGVTVSSAKTAIKKSGTFVVKRVVDGDTIVLSNGERVRLIGVDTPESVHPRKPVEYFSKEASAFTKKMVEGKPVRLEYDWNRRDKYGRTLAYVYRMPDNLFLNAEIVKQGYGHAYTRFPFKYMEEFRRYESEARDMERGLWKQ